MSDTVQLPLIEIPEQPLDHTPCVCGSGELCATCVECDIALCECECIRCSQCDDVMEEDTDCEQCACDCGMCRRKQPQCKGCCGHEVCGSCDHCIDYCECSVCDNCGSRDPDNNSCGCYCNHYSCRSCCNCRPCSECESCDCDCAEDNDGGNRGFLVKRPLRFIHSNRKEFATNNLRRMLSVEIEVASKDSTHGTADTARAYGCSIVEDGSLPSTGFEINTTPANGDKFVEEITALCTALRHDGASVDRSCGLHVHVDARDLRPLQVRALVELYCAIEPLLFAMLAPSRQDSYATVKCAAAYRNSILIGKDFRNKALKKATIGAVYGAGSLQYKANGFRNSKSEHRAGNRYYALNLHSYFYRGTIEFRHHHGTINAHKITTWARLCGSLVDAANRLPIQTIHNLAHGCLPHHVRIPYINDAFDLVGMAHALRAIVPDDVYRFALDRLDEFDYVPKDALAIMRRLRS